ncbi:MAG: MFS transporter [Actinomycetota bacterium]|nr:MFS transporter [Actinomycetota bacterium]
MDRLPWTGFHWLVVAGLGIAWILDGLEIQIISQVSAVMHDRGILQLSYAEVGLAASCYLFGEVVGALFFGRITDRVGRKKVFLFTLALYLIASGISGLSFDLWFLLLFRFLAGAGIGGEYAAIHSAIDELIPAYYRGRVDIALSGTYWFGAILGAAANVLLLNPNLLPTDLGWRIGFFIDPLIGLAIIFVRRSIPESPRWLMTHGRQEEAERIVDQIETRVLADGIKLQPVPENRALDVRPIRGSVSYRQIAKTMLRDYPSRSFLGFSMMVTQAFLYNAVFFTYSFVLLRFYGIENQATSYFFFPFAAGNLLGPLVLGKFFDTIGRRKMITLTYCVSGVLLAISAQLFSANLLTAATHTALWCVIFFFASAGASSAYLTVSEIFPLELRGQAISFFFAISQLAGGVAAPLIFGALIGDGTDPGPLTIGYYVSGAIMFAGGAIAWYYGVDAERKSLERIAHPLSEVLQAIEPPVEPERQPHRLWSELGPRRDHARNWR